MDERFNITYYKNYYGGKTSAEFIETAFDSKDHWGNKYHLSSNARLLALIIRAYTHNLQVEPATSTDNDKYLTTSIDVLCSICNLQEDDVKSALEELISAHVIMVGYINTKVFKVSIKRKTYEVII